VKWTNVLAAVAVFGLVSAAFAADKEAPKGEKAKSLAGKITKVEGTGVWVQPADKNAKEVGLETDAKTTVTIDGKEAKVADLKAGMNVTATWGADGGPWKIVATTAK